ncbi:hypothetical protein GOODEAATRI_001366 [Goodea atripinnis]|uniref:Uncharacterized protein n=1 Tax=Goodea atripinnis TaxID=208336 RepID=A0ABV0PUC3_9TELE
MTSQVKKLLCIRKPVRKKSRIKQERFCTMCMFACICVEGRSHRRTKLLRDMPATRSIAHCNKAGGQAANSPSSSSLLLSDAPTSLPRAEEGCLCRRSVQRSVTEHLRAERHS